MSPRIDAGPQTRSADELLDPTTRDPIAAKRVDDWLELQRQLCWRPVEAKRLLEQSGGDPAAVLLALAGRSRPDAARDAQGRASLVRLAARLLPLTAHGYPRALRALPDPPPLLSVWGDVKSLTRPAVAIVGARAATRYGRGVAHELAGQLAQAGLVVVSGLARGVDAEAHRGALEAGGATVAILACGLDRVYPPEHRELAARIAGQGAVVSELPVGTKPLPFHFPLRNRIISGLSLAVIVVEARPRSGSLITARHGLDQGREVLAVPGPVNAPTSAGPNALLRDGARPVLDVTDVLEQIGWEPTAEVARRTSASPPPGRALTRAERRLVERLVDGPATRDELVRALDATAAEIASCLGVLQLDGIVNEDRDGRLGLSAGQPPDIGAE